MSDDTGRIAMLERRTVGNAGDDNGTSGLLTRYIYSNHLQSASLELDEEGEIISYEEYHPYGTTSYQAMNASINAVAKRYRYTGKERDEESGLYTMGARYYIPWLCRWTSPEPINSENYNLAKGYGLEKNKSRHFLELTASSYEYAYDNPVVYSDPSGEQPPLPYQPNMKKLILVDGASISSYFSFDKSYSIKKDSGDNIELKPSPNSVKSILYKGIEYDAFFSVKDGTFTGYKNADGVNYFDAIKPQIKSRSEWGAQTVNDKNGYTPVSNPYEFYTHIAIHHSGNTNSPSPLQVQKEHMKRDKGTWHDVGYHFMIGLDGTIYEGRSLDKRGAGAGPADNKAGIIHIVILGDMQNEGIWEWSNDALTKEAVNSLINLSKYLVMKYDIQNLGGHQEVRCNHTECPGNQVMTIMNDVRSETRTINPECLHTDK